jgi:hypothetical protein
MNRTPHPTADLLVGRRELDDIPGYEPLTDVTWHGAARQWVLHFRLHVPIPAAEVQDETVPEATDWYALIAPEYPAGAIKVYPAAVGGLQQTYPHQAANRSPRPGEPWRQGDVCVATPARGFGRFVLDAELHDAPARLWWHIARTRSWVEAARRGELLREGEPFELPVYASATRPLVVFDEIAASLAAWQDVDERFGYATLAEPKANARLRVVLGFTSPGRAGQELLTAQWGAHFADSVNAGVPQRAAWVRCNELPALPPWRAPENLGELTTALAAQGVELMAVLQQLAPGLRDKAAHFLLIGAPVPVRVGEMPVLMHWLALRLPTLSAPTQPQKGFRPGEEGAWRRDAADVLSPTRSISWVPTGNWAPEEIATRGRAAPSLRDARIVLIGAGALGSMIAELLVREGVTEVTVLDGETLQAGNLVRHTLTVAEVGAPKATTLAQRLNLVNPHAQVVGIEEEFPGEARGQAALAEADVVIDSTGSDSLLQQLHLHEWRGDKLFVSVSIGFFARRLFFFAARGASFPLEELAAVVDPWLLYEREEFGDSEMPWEGTGCWHPVFPARASDFAMLGGVTLRQLEAAFALPEGEYTFHVTERVEDGSGAIQLLRASLPDRKTNV